MSATPYQQLEQEWRRLHAFRGALSLLRWDAAVMMPRGSAELRGEQVAALETEYHALLTTPKVTRLLDRAQNVWTKDFGRAMRMSRKVRSGQVYINGYGAGGGVELPFGGFKNSGHGREKGLEALKEFSATKTVVINHGS